MLGQILRWLAGIVGQQLIDFAHPELKAEIDALLSQREQQAVKDEQAKVVIAEAEARITERNADAVVEADQAAIKQNAIDIANERNKAAEKLKQVEEAETIEEVLKIK